MEANDIKEAVRDKYGRIASSGGSCCGSDQGGSCSGESAAEVAARMGYDPAEIGSVPDGANLGLGCGNPVALASLREGESVLDLGSGAGFDCFLAARAVGRAGRVIGVDMTPEMVRKATENARVSGFENVEFRLGSIEDLPVPDNNVDAIISNCVINLSTDKARVLAEAYRVLKPGGRVMISDIVLTRELPEAVRASVTAYVGCIAGAVRKEVFLESMERVGFEDIQVVGESTFTADPPGGEAGARSLPMASPVSEADWADAARAVVSIKVFAKKAG